MLRLFLFGTPRIERDGEVVPLRRTKAQALLAYLALARRPQDRDALIALLWPEFDEASARNNLRRELSLLKTALGEEFIVANRLQVAWNEQAESWLDVAVFQAQSTAWKQHRHAPEELCAECASALTTAARIYGDDFLAGFHLPDSPAFDDWQFFQREGLRQQLADALQALARWHGQRAEHGEAIDAGRRWLALDPLHEPAQRELMRLYAWSGQHTAALRQYDEGARLLDKELGVAPEAETTTLYEQIRSRAFVRQADKETRDKETRDKGQETRDTAVETVRSPASSLPVSQSVTHNLPQTTGFVGRQRELADILRRLTDPACRLLTLVGPGGIGKTRLALQAAQTLADEWADEDAIADGVLFVPLAAVSTSGGLLPALAAAAQLDFYPHAPQQQQLLDYFRSKRMLLVLDNFEQLLDAAGFVGALLAAAPRLRLLVTSREALNVHEEWFHPIDGLSFPAEDDDISGVAQLARFDSVRLFEQHARRVRSDFSLSRVREHVVRLCQLVGGMPLAIELAASWLKVLSVEQVVAAIERGLDILSARDSNIPTRHRSMRAVLEESWRLLSAEERLTLVRLTVFCGDFSTEAAQAVASELKIENEQLKTAHGQTYNLHFTIYNLLAALVDKALLRNTGPGRFQVHELLRQFAEERLHEWEGQAALAQAGHREFFIGLARRAQGELHGPRQQEWVACLAADQDNLRAVLSRAQAAGDVRTLLELVAALWQFWNIRGYRSEGRGWLRTALEQSHATHSDRALAALRAMALRGAGTLALNQDDYADAQACYEASLAEYEGLGDVPGLQMALNNLGLVAFYQGNLIEARAYFERSMALSPQSGSDWNLDAVTHNLALVLAQQGDMAGARPLFEQSLGLSRARADVLGIQISLVDYASALANHGDYAAADSLANESLVLSREAGNTQLTSDALGVLGQIAVLRGDTGRARQLLEQAITLSRAVDEGKNIPIKTQIYLGMALLREADMPAALAKLCEALTSAYAIMDGAQVVLALQILACAATARGDARRAALLFGAGEALSRAQGQALLPAECALTMPYVRAVRVALGAGAFAAAWAEGKDLTVERAYALASEIEWQLGVEPLRDQLAQPFGLTPAEEKRQATGDESGASSDRLSPVTRSPGPPVSSSLVEPLTEREREVLQLIAAGLSNQEIAGRLILSVGTVKWHAGHIYGKLAVRTRTQAIARAQTLRLLS